MAQREHAVVTQEMIDDVRRRIGVEWIPKEPYYNIQATRDGIRHFADGIGDLNPLYRDEEHAKKTRWGKIIAPPSFYYSIYLVGRSVGMPGIHGWFSGGDWEFYRPLYVDEFIVPHVKLIDMVEKGSQHAGRIFFQYSEVVFTTRSGDILAKAIGSAARAERRAAGEHGKEKHKEIKEATYTADEMDRIIKAAIEEKPRGAEPRYWEDIMEHTRAQEIGIVGAYDYGPQRMSWLFNLVTNWMGDDGFLWKLNAQIRRFNVVGDTTWLKGKVTRKCEEHGMRLAELDIRTENQRGEVTAPGFVVVSLSSRGQGPAGLPPKPE